MYSIAWYWLCLALLVGILMPGQAQAQYTLFADIPYDEIPGVDPNLLALDIYVPDGADGTNTVMIMYHGGSFISGDKAIPEVVHPKMDYYTALGWVFLSVNYRLTNVDLPAGHPDQVSHPDHIEDVANSIAWIAENISSYGGDPQRLLLMGFSAGAHLVALAATDETRLEVRGYSLDIIDGVVALDGMYDIPLRYTQFPPPPAHNILIWGDELRSQQDMSPSFHVDPLECIPPMLIIHGEPQNNVEQADAFANELVRAGFAAEAYEATGLTHSQIGAAVGITGHPLTTEVDDFIAGLDFGDAGCPAAGVPTVSRWGVVILALAVGIAGSAIVRRRSTPGKSCRRRAKLRVLCPFI